MSEIVNVSIDFTSIETYLKCGLQYKFRYVDGIKSPPAIAMIEGSSHHSALEMNNLYKMKKGYDMKPGLLTEKFEDELINRTGKIDRLDWQDENKDKLLKRAKVLHLRYIKDWAPKIEPVQAERKFERLIRVGKETYRIHGTLDLEVGDAIWDYKVVRKVKSQSEAESSIQLSFYAFAAKKNRAGYICFVKSSNPYIASVESRRSPQQMDWALKIGKMVQDSIKRKVFNPTNPTNWWCSARFCGYWNACRGKYERHNLLVGGK